MFVLVWEKVVKRVYKRCHRNLFVFVCLFVCLGGGWVGGCNIYTPYCPISSPLSTHHSCQYLVRYEAEKGKRRTRRALQMDITVAFAC